MARRVLGLPPAPVTRMARSDLSFGIMLCLSVSFPYLKSLACRFLVMDGSFTTRPSSSGAMTTWHPRRLVSVRPKARSSMSFSSSSGSGILSYRSSFCTMTWHVEQAQDPPHAPGTGRKCQLHEKASLSVVGQGMATWRAPATAYLPFRDHVPGLCRASCRLSTRPLCVPGRPCR